MATSCGRERIETGAEKDICTIHSLHPGEGVLRVAWITPDTVEYEGRFPVSIEANQHTTMELE